MWAAYFWHRFKTRLTCKLSVVGFLRPPFGSFKGTVMGDVTFEPNGQLGSKHYLFTVQDRKIAVQK